MIEKGSVINDTYRIEEKIGAGGGGTVFKAYHLRLEKYVVVKRINDAWVDIMDSRKEADLIKLLKHQYLPQAYDFLHLPDGIYTVMDFVPGDSLDKYIKNGCQFTQQQVLYWAKQITEALVYLHGLQPPIIHSDIKPANIMVTPEGNICLIDFNVSMTGTPNSSISATSRGYAAPEQYLNLEPLNHPENGKPFVPQYQFGMTSPLDQRSDIYSLGATLFHLMTGQRPPKLPEHQLPEIPADLPGFDETLIRIVNRMTCYDPRERYQSAGELLYDLQHIKELDKRLIRQRRSRRILNVVFAALLTGAALLSLFGYLTMQREASDAYGQQISTAESMVKSQEYEAAAAAYQEAMTLNDKRIDAYLGMLSLYDAQGEYAQLVEYGERQSGNDFTQYGANDQQMGDYFYLMANACFELEDYQQAAQYYDIAIKWYQDNADYYRDRAIALARSGYVDKAAETLQQAQAVGLSGGGLDFVRAELALAQSDYTTAAEGFQKASQGSSDTVMKQRALLSLGRVYREQGNYEQSIRTLKEALPQLDEVRTRSAHLLCAEAYLKLADTTTDKTFQQNYAQQAVNEYTAATMNGVATKKTQFNLATAYQYLDDIEHAQQILNRMRTDYPADAEVYARLAILEVYKEAKHSVDKQDYSQFKAYYDRAKRLSQSAKTDGTASPYLTLMETYYQELKDKNRL